MTNDIKTTENNNQLMKILNSPAISGKISGNEEAKLLQIEFAPTNSFTYKSTTIKATATKVTEANFYRKAPSEEERNRLEDYNKNLHTQALENGSSPKETQLTLTITRLSLLTKIEINQELISILQAAEAVYGLSFTNQFANTLDLIDTTFFDLKLKNKLYEHYIENSILATDASYVISKGASIDIKDGVREINEYNYI